MRSGNSTARAVAKTSEVHPRVTGGLVSAAAMETEPLAMAAPAAAASEPDCRNVRRSMTSSRDDFFTRRKQEQAPSRQRTTSHRYLEAGRPAAVARVEGRGTVFAALPRNRRYRGREIRAAAGATVSQRKSIRTSANPYPFLRPRTSHFDKGHFRHRAAARRLVAATARRTAQRLAPR